MIDEHIEEEEEYNVQRAILASLQGEPSLQGQHGDDDDDILAPSAAPAAPLPPPPPPAPLPPPPPQTPAPPCLSPEETISDDNASTDSETF